MRLRSAIALLLLSPVLTVAPAPASAAVAGAGAEAALTTVAERSGFARTGRIDEVAALCDAFARAHPGAVRCIRYGTTPEGRAMQALVASRSGALTPEAARARGLPVTLVQGGIHAGEIDGKDAGFLALRQVLDGTAAPGALEQQVLVFVPVFNVDGHERFGAWNRPNQRGPEAMGWRTTAQNLNLNRDYLKADAPEMRAMLALVSDWDPLVYVDLHATNGAQFEHDISIQVEPLNSGDDALRTAGLALRTRTIDDLAAGGALPLAFYPSFVERDNPASGFVDDVSAPRFSTGYFPLRNRFAMLVETHSWKPYPVRVALTRDTVVSVLAHVAREGAALRALADAADARAAALGGTPVALTHAATDLVRTIPFRGYAYTRTQSPVSGALVTRYDETRPQVWHVPLRDEVVAARQVIAPRGGYLVPAMHATRVADLLDAHGVAYSRVAAALPDTALEVFRADSMRFAPMPMEGRQRMELEGTWQAERRDVPAGALFVPMAQPRARIAVALLEPQAPDSLAAWGAFANHFERKEYMEPYVAEDVARAMLADDPALRTAFERRLARDPGFAASPEARLEFFYRRHSAWDERFGLYPVFRTATAPR